MSLLRNVVTVRVWVARTSAVSTLPITRVPCSLHPRLIKINYRPLLIASEQTAAGDLRTLGEA